MRTVRDKLLPFICVVLTVSIFFALGFASRFVFLQFRETLLNEWNVPEDFVFYVQMAIYICCGVFASNVGKKVFNKYR